MPPTRTAKPRQTVAFLVAARHAAPAVSLSSPSGPRQRASERPGSPSAATSAAHRRPPSESVAIRPPAGERAGPELAQPRGRAPGTGVWRSRGPRSRGERGGHPDILPATYRGRPCLSSSGHWATREALTASAAGPKSRGPRRWRRRWKRNSAPGPRLPPDLPRPRAPRPGASPAARSTRAELPARLPRELPPRESWPGRPRKSPPTSPRDRPLPERRQWKRSAGSQGRGEDAQAPPLAWSGPARRGSLGVPVNELEGCEEPHLPQKPIQESGPDSGHASDFAEISFFSSYFCLEATPAYAQGFGPPQSPSWKCLRKQIECQGSKRIVRCKARV